MINLQSFRRCDVIMILLCVKKVELFSGYLRQKKIREEKLGVEKFEWTMSIRSPTKVAPTEWGSESVTNLLPGEVLEMLRYLKICH